MDKFSVLNLLLPVDLRWPWTENHPVDRWSTFPGRKKDSNVTRQFASVHEVGNHREGTLWYLFHSILSKFLFVGFLQDKWTSKTRAIKKAANLYGWKHCKQFTVGSRSDWSAVWFVTSPKRLAKCAAFLWKQIGRSYDLSLWENNSNLEEVCKRKHTFMFRLLRLRLFPRT